VHSGLPEIKNVVSAAMSSDLSEPEEGDESRVWENL
jgi:hypothetical protein